jgi:hypothetical protein
MKKKSLASATEGIVAFIYPVAMLIFIIALLICIFWGLLTLVL